MPAEIGRGAAGFTNIVTRSGAGGFHGSFFEFLRNSALDARNYFDHPTPVYPGRIPPFRRNEFGFTNGGPVIMPHLYDGRARTFYFTQYQGFRQVARHHAGDARAHRRRARRASTPTAISRRHAQGSRRSRHRRRSGALSAAERPVGSIRRAHLCDSLEGHHQRQPVLPAPRPQIERQRSVLCALQHRQPDRPHYQSRPDGHRSFLCHYYIDRQRNVVGTYTRTVSPRLILVSSLEHHALHARISHAQSHRPRRQVQRWPLRGVQFRRGIGDAGLRQSLPGPPARQLLRRPARPSKPAWRRASIATPPTSASAPTANTTLAAAPPTPRNPSRPRAERTTFIPAIRCPIRSRAFFPAAPSLTPSLSRLRTSPAASTSVPRPSTATTSASSCRTR